MKAVLDKLSKMPNFQAQPRDFRGEVIYNLEAPGLPHFGNANQTMGVAVVSDYLMFSTDVGRIEQVIIGDKDRKPLADSEKYQIAGQALSCEDVDDLVPGTGQTVEAVV